MNALERILRELLGPPPKPPRKPRKSQKKTKIACSNTAIHGGNYYIKGKVKYWNNRPMCNNCHKHYTKNIKVIR